MSAHSILAPSSAAVWSQCPGSVLASKAFPETEENQAAREGTEAHDAAAQYITGVLAGAGAPEDADEAVAMYADEVLARASGGECIVGVEERVACTAVHPDCFGTCDAYIYDHEARTLYVYDFKYGRGPVDVVENKQLLVYASGLIQRVPEVETVELVIVQPRAFHRDGPVRSWKTDRATVKQWAQHLGQAAREATGQNPSTVSGSHCRYCRMRWACPAAIEAMSSLYEAVADYIPHSIDGEDLGALYTVTTRALKHLENMAAGMSAEIDARIRNGQPVAGYRLKPTKGRKTWAVSVDEVLQLGEFAGVDVSKPGVVTPKQAEALGLDVPDSYIKQESKMKLTETNAADVFGRK